MAAKDEVDPRLNKVYKNNGDHRALFDDWASTYDHDLIDDLGCGTGLVGRCLKAASYTDIHGNDYIGYLKSEGNDGRLLTLERY